MQNNLYFWVDQESARVRLNERSWNEAPQPCEARARILRHELVPLTTVLLSQMGQMDMEIEEKCLL